MIRRLLQERRGAATIEFALLAVFFLGVMLVALDIGTYLIQRSSLRQAVSAAATSSFSQRDTVNYAAIPEYVRRAARAPATTLVTTNCNGSSVCTNSARSCACLTRTATYVAAASCGTPCSGSGMVASSTAGYYLRITASYGYQPLVLPRGLLTASSISETATVRLQ